MRDLNKEELKIKDSIQNGLRQYASDFRTRVTEDQIARMSERLTVYGFNTLDIETGMEKIISSGEDRFPTAQQLRGMINAHKASIKNTEFTRDPQTQKDINKFNENYKMACLKFGQETIDKYCETWIKVFFKGSEDFAKSINIKISNFRRLAIDDLKRYGGNFKMALEYVNKERLKIHGE